MLRLIGRVDVAVVLTDSSRPAGFQFSLHALQLALKARDRIVLAFDTDRQLLQIQASVFSLLLVLLDESLQAGVLLHASLQAAEEEEDAKVIRQEQRS